MQQVNWQLITRRTRCSLCNAALAAIHPARTFIRDLPVKCDLKARRALMSL